MQIGSSARRIAVSARNWQPKLWIRKIRSSLTLGPEACVLVRLTEMEEAFQASFGAVDDFARECKSYSSALEENPVLRLKAASISSNF